MKRLKRILLVFGIFFIYLNRYKIMNVCLKSKWMREKFIQLSMQIPLIGRKFLQGAFK